MNVNLARWPTRRIRGDETADLVTKLRGHGVVEAWAGSFDALLHKDIGAVNAHLVRECRAQSAVRLVPFGSVNPLLPDWEEELRRCVEVHKMPGIRLYPGYHGYSLEQPSFRRLVELAARRRLVVCLGLAMEDERMMHALLRTPAVDPKPLAALVARTPDVRLVLLNALRVLQGEALLAIVRAGEVYVDISMLEGVGGVASLLEDVPLERILFGSHAPFFYFESALLKLRESALSASQLEAVRQGNARRLLSRSG